MGLVIQSAINEHLIEWDKIARRYRNTMQDAAEAENEYRRARAKFIIRAKDADPKLSQAGAETLADADDEVMNLRLKRMALEADVEALKQKLFWCRSKADSLRSEKVDEREANRLYAENPAGA